MILPVSLRSSAAKTAVLLMILSMSGALSACGSKPATEQKTITSDSAGKAISTITHLFTIDPTKSRPSPMLGLFVTLFLERGTAASLTSPLIGVGSAMKLQEEDRIDIDATFKLLQELGTALQVNVPDLLDHSQNRPGTLNDYMTSLQNVTQRSRTEAEKLDAAEVTLRAKQNTEQETVTTLQRQTDDAIRDKDYAAAGAGQPPLTEAQTALDATKALSNRTHTVHELYKTLLKIAEERVAAIEQNREILIAGLKVIELPGIEDLGILQQGGEQRQDMNLLLPFGAF